VDRIVAIKMVLQVAVRDIGQLTDLALEPDEPVVRRLTGRVGRSRLARSSRGRQTTDRSAKRF
jgi:hypothetical protein